MPPASSIPENCPHERRPGLTVCLHCRHEALQAEAARRRRSLSRAALVVGVIGLGAMLATAAMRAREEAASPGETSLALASEAPDRREVAAAGAAPRSDLPSDSAVRADSARASAPAAPLAPVVAAGRTELPDGLSVVRAGDSLVVHFDTELGRTRRPEKFERIVRATLPMIYGAGADSLLAGVPSGAIAGAGELLTELPAHGLRLPAGDGWSLVVRPETRPGRDGPLVVRYIATVER